MTPKFIVKNMLTNKACIGMLLGIILGALGVHKAIDGTAAGEIVTSLLSFITAPTSALILIVMGYQLHVSKKLLRPVLTTMGLRLGVLAVVCAAVSGILFAIIPYDKPLLLALMLQYTLPAPFIIPLYRRFGRRRGIRLHHAVAGHGARRRAVLLPRGVQSGISLGKGLRNRMAERRKPKRIKSI